MHRIFYLYAFKKNCMKAKFLLLVFVVGLTLPAMAYDAFGHRIVANIAYQNLTCQTRHKVDKLLGKHGLTYESTWSDDIRSDSAYAYSYDWHFQNLREGMTPADIQTLFQNPTAEGRHLFFAIDSLSGSLKKNKEDVEALKFLIHFIADAHQPMHLGRAEDRGGNDVMIKWFGKDIRLHQLWDTQMIEGHNFSYSEYTAYLQDKFAPRKKEFKQQSLPQSVEAVYLVRNKIYAYNYTNLRAYSYMYQFNNDLDEMLYRGGIQLANLLNEIF